MFKALGVVRSGYPGVNVPVDHLGGKSARADSVHARSSEPGLGTRGGPEVAEGAGLPEVSGLALERDPQM